MFRYRLRTLLIVLALGPPVVWVVFIFVARTLASLFWWSERF